VAPCSPASGKCAQKTNQDEQKPTCAEHVPAGSIAEPERSANDACVPSCDEPESEYQRHHPKKNRKGPAVPAEGGDPRKQRPLNARKKCHHAEFPRQVSVESSPSLTTKPTGSRLSKSLARDVSPVIEARQSLSFPAAKGTPRKSVFRGTLPAAAPRSTQESRRLRSADGFDPAKADLCSASIRRFLR
jgi:hypothetical protein